MKNSITYSVTAESLIRRFKLEHYVSRLFISRAKDNPYHNIRHMLHVMLECYEAAVSLEIPHSEIRPLLLAALLHDLDHPGIRRPDSENISDSINAIRNCVQKKDKSILEKVCRLVQYTEYPNRADLPPNILGDIIRDADLTQAFIGHTAWVNEVLIGLSLEWKISLTPEHIDGQITFVKSIQWKTRWAQEKYSDTVRAAKVAEYESWKRILFPAQ